MCVCVWAMLPDTNKIMMIMNIKSKVRMTYNTSGKIPKLFYVTKLYKQQIRNDFLRRLAEYSRSSINQSINQSIKTLIHVDRPQRDKVHMVKIKIKSTMIHNNNNLNLNM